MGSEVGLFPFGYAALVIIVGIAVLNKLKILRLEVPKKDQHNIKALIFIGVPIIFFPVALWLDDIFYGTESHPTSWILWVQIGLMILGFMFACFVSWRARGNSGSEDT